MRHAGRDDLTLGVDAFYAGVKDFTTAAEAHVLCVTVTCAGGLFRIIGM